MTPALEPCPFCGGSQLCTAPSAAFGPTWSVICKACGATVDRETEAEAIAAWNHRTHGEASEVELLEGIIADLIREKDDPRHAESPNLRMGLSVAILKIHAALSDRSKQEE
jgi:Lar family restriction alleviation protein